MPNNSFKRISLSISGGSDISGKAISYHSWPVTQGIPFAEGELEKEMAVRIVDSKGTIYPTQVSPLAYWNKDLKYVRWLLVDFQTDYEEGVKNEFFLEYGKNLSTVQNVQNVPNQQTVSISQADENLLVDTGVMKLEIKNRFKPWKRSGRPEIFGRCLIKNGDAWHDIFTGQPGPFLYMKDQRGCLYDSYSHSPGPRVFVEESGPVRSSICIKGFHAAANGHRFCPYILRLHFFAGKSDIRIFHTFIFDQEPHNFELSAIGINFPFSLGKSPYPTVGGADTAQYARGWKSLSFLQNNDKDYNIFLDDREFKQGQKTSGWAALSGTIGSAVAVIKDLWKEYPKGFALDQHGIDIQIWPEAYGKNLSFTTPFEEPAIFFNHTRDENEFKRLLKENPTAPLNLKSLNIETDEDLIWVEEMLKNHGKGRAASHNDTGTSNGTGASKTTEIFLRLSADKTGKKIDAEALANAVQEPLIAPADPEYSCATGAFEHFYHASDPQFKEIDAGLDYLLNSVAVEPVKKCRLYGMMRYGNMVCSHAAAPGISYILYKDTDPEKALRYVGPYNNEANDQIMGVWGNFLRTGNREHLFLAEKYSRNIADVGIIHAHPGEPESVGLMHYHNCHQWSGEGSPSHTLISGILTDYYVTGNRRLLEVAREVGDWAVRNQEDCGIISCRNGILHREFTGPLWCLYEIYRATWKEKYGELARKSLNWFLNTIKEPGTYPVSVYTRGERGDEAVVEPSSSPLGHARDLYYIYASALRLSDNELLRKQIIAEADFFLWEGLTDNFVTAEMARESLTPRSYIWKVDDEFYWTNWGISGNYNTTIIALAYDLTGDMKYAAFCKDHLEGHFLRLVKRCRCYADWRFTWICFGSYIPRLMRVVADARKKGDIDETEKKWKQERSRLGRPAYSGQGVDLDKDRMNSIGIITNRPPDDLPREAPPRMYEPKTNLGRLSTGDKNDS